MIMNENVRQRSSNTATAAATSTNHNKSLSMSRQKQQLPRFYPDDSKGNDTDKTNNFLQLATTKTKYDKKHTTKKCKSMVAKISVLIFIFVVVITTVSLSSSSSKQKKVINTEDMKIVKLLDDLVRYIWIFWEQVGMIDKFEPFFQNYHEHYPFLTLFEQNFELIQNETIQLFHNQSVEKDLPSTGHILGFKHKLYVPEWKSGTYVLCFFFL